MDGMINMTMPLQLLFSDQNKNITIFTLNRYYWALKAITT
jgi:hypothetical protein